MFTRAGQSFDNVVNENLPSVSQNLCCILKMIPRKSRLSETKSNLGRFVAPCRTKRRKDKRSKWKKEWTKERISFFKNGKISRRFYITPTFCLFVLASFMYI